MNGLDPILKRLLTAHSYTKFDALNAAAIKCEQANSEIRRPVHAISDAPIHVEATEERQYYPPYQRGCWHCGNMQHIRRFCPAYRQTAGDNWRGRGTRPRGQYRGRPAYQNYPSKN